MRSYNFYDLARLISLTLGGISAFLVLCLAARVATWAGPWTPSAYSFILFNAAFSLLLVGLMAASPWFHARFGSPVFRRLVEPLTEAVLTGVLTILWLSGFVAIAVAQPVNSPADVRGVAKAATSFAFIGMAAFGLLFAIRLRDCLVKAPLSTDFDHGDKYKASAGVLSSSPQGAASRPVASPAGLHTP
ncbi:hypothetical protein IWQ60_011353 [Tieghemiomyces parasiticus]|uniref:MARVEL domain-containing protein n=1 Tax=Tieghemiomyces parasiticus TaxID=78921 RepID=A0A9W8DII9_9FUNG|nr:hypothetical protein IWQ60_011353 [Tieghemiomyces parasiticus]